MFKRKQPKGVSSSGVNYENLGKAVESALVLDYVYLLHSTRRQVWSSFMRGVFTGLGTVIGATVGVTLLLALLHSFGGAPIIGQFFRDISETIQHSKSVR
jgi:hypothetical protein